MHNSTYCIKKIYQETQRALKETTCSRWEIHRHTKSCCASWLKPWLWCGCLRFACYTVTWSCRKVGNCSTFEETISLILLGVPSPETKGQECKGASMQASKRASKPAIKQTSKQANKQRTPTGSLTWTLQRVLVALSVQCRDTGQGIRITTCSKRICLSLFEIRILYCNQDVTWQMVVVTKQRDLKRSKSYVIILKIENELRPKVKVQITSDVIPPRFCFFSLSFDYCHSRAYCQPGCSVLSSARHSCKSSASSSSALLLKLRGHRIEFVASV